MSESSYRGDPEPQVLAGNIALACGSPPEHPDFHVSRLRRHGYLTRAYDVPQHMYNAVPAVQHVIRLKSDPYVALGYIHFFPWSVLESRSTFSDVVMIETGGQSIILPQRGFF